MLPKLRPLLTVTKYDYVNARFSLEERVSIAACLWRVCALRAKRGEELLQSLSVILVYEANPVPYAYAVRALYELCKAGVLDIFAAWKVLRSNSSMFGQTDLVDIQICSLLGLVAREVTGVALQDELKLSTLKELLANLWQYTKRSEATVRAAAYRSLTSQNNQSAIVQITVDAPQQYLDLLRLEAAQGSTDSLVAAEELVASVLSAELKERRGLGTVDKSSNQDISLINEALAVLPPFLAREYEVCLPRAGGYI